MRALPSDRSPRSARGCNCERGPACGYDQERDFEEPLGDRTVDLGIFVAGADQEHRRAFTANLCIQARTVDRVTIDAWWLRVW